MGLGLKFGHWGAGGPCVQTRPVSRTPEYITNSHNNDTIFSPGISLFSILNDTIVCV
jgi:hypothetical protein